MRMKTRNNQSGEEPVPKRERHLIELKIAKKQDMFSPANN
jgi:hypothetical protein